ncbi:twin-arginine translocase TatA/TatE family subunit [Antribacter sp. KLBMP9083]|uniref:Twin-arginine translocase TatA/TatE family subunit n=1 Tax=Antribacter soli TaxID=2910976 RepID=A0AA41U6A4_9MICO|nr:twin-arginine translocase TatA/TatE family subunit [Antribacter soli]MCF4120241.1 twin-arginine translocase TatA/TatE family subunit [Antribacter soli]
MLGINGGELVVILVIAVLVIGPERLPQYAEQLARGVRRVKALLQDAKTRVDEELGPEFTDVDWSKLDPRQYDPRRIVRDALLDDTPLSSAPSYRTGLTRAAAAAGASVPGGAQAAGADRPTSGSPAPFDDEAT